MTNVLPVLSDGVITIRPFVKEDAEKHLKGEDEVQIKWLSGGKSTLEGVNQWIQKNLQYWKNDGPVYNFAILDSKNTLIGMIEANTDAQQVEGMNEGEANISYGLYERARGQGYATRSVDLIINFLRKKGFKHAIIRVDPENQSSLRVAEKSHFVKQANFKTKSGEVLMKFVKNI